MPGPAQSLALLPWLAMVALTAAVVLGYRANRIGVVVGLLFAAASFSRITAPLGPYAVRVEQPALAILVGIVLLRERAMVRRVVGRHVGVVLAATAYLAANVMASALFAARPLDSLRIAAWLALSMAGGLAVAALIAREPSAARRLPGWILGAAAVQVGIALAAVASEALLRTTWGVQATDLALGKAYALSWEANILAINLAMGLAFLLVPGSGLRLSRRWRLAATVWLGLGVGLAYSRGGAVGLIAAVLVVGLLVAWTARPDPVLAMGRYGRPALGLGALAVAVAYVTTGGLDLLMSRGVGWTASAVGPGLATPSAPPGTSPSPATSPASTAGPSTPGATESLQPSPSPPFVGTSDTIAVRLNNIGIALRELSSSPLIGLGTDSYQQRHTEPSCRCPAAISNLAVGALYDSGVLGFLGLSLFLAGMAYLAWSRGEWAYLTALVVIVIGYQATDALRFASNWILMGAILGLATYRGWAPATARLARLDENRAEP